MEGSTRRTGSNPSSKMSWMTNPRRDRRRVQNKSPRTAASTARRHGLQCVRRLLVGSADLQVLEAEEGPPAAQAKVSPPSARYANARFVRKSGAPDWAAAASPPATTSKPRQRTSLRKRRGCPTARSRRTDSGVPMQWDYSMGDWVSHATPMPAAAAEIRAAESGAPDSSQQADCSKPAEKDETHDEAQAGFRYPQAARMKLICTNGNQRRTRYAVARAQVAQRDVCLPAQTIYYN